MSTTWQLLNPQGQPDFTQGDMDIVIDQTGHFLELQGQAVLDQRLKKTVVTIRGSNTLDPDLGSNVRNYLGGKTTGRKTALAIGSDLERMIQHLVVSQSELQQRVDPIFTADELVTGVRQFGVQFGLTDVEVTAVIRTQAGDFQASLSAGG